MFDTYSEYFDIIAVISEIKLMHNILPMNYSFPLSSHEYIGFFVHENNDLFIFTNIGKSFIILIRLKRTGILY